MAAPQQHALTNTSCTFSTSPAAFSSSAGSYGSGQPAFCGDLHGRVSVTNDRDVPSVVCPSTVVVPQPILAHSASRKTKPCSLCGTAALRSQSSLVPNSPIGPQEQPVVLLHRLEDGLPEGDVDSLRAFGTIRLLPVHRHCGKVEPITDDSKHECDRKYQSVTSHTMAPGSLAYKSFKRGHIKKRTELPAGNRSYGDLNSSLTNELSRTYSASDDHHTLRGKPSEKTVKSDTNIVKSEVDSGGTSHCANKRTEVHVCDNSAGSRLDPGEEALGAHRKAVSSRHNYPQYSTTSLTFSVSPAPQSSHRVSSPQHQTLASSQAETLDRSATIRSPLSSLNNLSSPQTSTSFPTNIHSYGNTSQSCTTQDTIQQRSFSPDTPMSVVCSPVVPLTTTTLTSSPSQNLSSPSAISPPQSPSSPASPFSPPFMCSPSACDRENLHSSCSTEIQPSSSPYSPCTLPSLPASPTSLPSSSESPPSPAPSIDSPPASPATSTSQQSEASHNQAPRQCSEKLDGDPHEDVTNSAAHLDTVFESKTELERSKTRNSKTVPQYHISRVSSMENAEELSNKSSIGQQEIAQTPSASLTVRAPSGQIYMPVDASTASQNSETEIQENLCPETSVGSECEDRKKNVAQVEHLKPDFSKCFLNSESESVEIEKNSSDPRNSLMKLVLKVKHPGKQQLPLGPEKKEYNKENGIPKIVLTLRGKGPNKEYSCSNRLRNDSESCSGENVNNKKHKSKRNKRQKPKDREKTKKIMKGDKHKRHLELFGEDSNDSCDINPDKHNDYPVGERHPRTSIDAQELCPSLPPSTLQEPPPVDGERDLPPTFSPSDSPSDCAKDGESGETIDSPPSPVDDSLSQSLQDLASDASEINTVIRGKTKDRPSIEENEEVHEGQTKSAENSTQEAFKLTVEVPETPDDEPPCSKLKKEETSQASPGMLHCSDISHQDKQTEGLVLRSRRSRHAKNTESGRNSDACLWVSFGVNAPVPLPATDLPSLEPVFTCKEKMKPKESETNETKGHASPSHLLVGVGEKSISKATHKGWKERENTETVPDGIKEDTEQEFEEKVKLLPTEYSDCKTDPSYSHYKVQYSSSHKDSNCAHSRIRTHGDLTHHRSRQSHKRRRKSEDCREEVVKKEMESCQPNALDALKRDDNRNQEASTNSYEEQSATSDLTPVYDTEDVRIESEEKSATKEPSTFPDVSLPISGNSDGHKDQSNVTSQPEENVASNEVTDKPERQVSEEAPDNLYYRPKKIRKACNSKMTTDHWNEKTSPDQAEDFWKAQISRPMEKINNSYKDGDSVKFSSPKVVTATTSSEVLAAESELSRVECDTSEVKTDVHWKPHEELMKRDVQPKSPQDSEISSEQRKRKYRSPTPQGQERITKVSEESLDEQAKHAAEEVKEEATENQSGIGKDCLPGNEDNEKQEVSKKEKEKRKKSRREKRKDNSGPGSRCSVLQEAQHRREVEYEEERGRRLAQEIKGFNWLEQKIKNSSLLSSRSAPSTPTTSPSAKESEPTSRTLSTPTAIPSTQFSFSNKEEEHARKNSFSGSSGGIGLKRHLQTAVPPQVPSSKVTALPKRRQSLGPPATPPCSASALCSVTSLPSMTVQDALYTYEPTHYRSEHGRVGPTLEKSSTGFGHEHAESDKATLYSSTSSTKATLYGVKDNNFETFYDTVNANAVNYYGRANSSNIDTQYNIATSPAICFYGSAKYQELGLHPDKTSSTGSHTNTSIISTSHDSSATTDHQLDTLHSPKPDIYSSRNSDWSTKQGSSPNSSSQHAGYSADSHSPQRFSHKQALLRRAFQEMLKSDPNNSSTEQAKEKQIITDSSPTKTEMNKVDGSKCKETETACFTSSQSSSERTSPADITSLKSPCPDSAPLLLSNKSSSETTDSCIFSSSPESVTASIKSEKDLSDPVSTEGKISSLSTGMSDDAEKDTCILDSNNKTVKSESDPNITENYSDLETSVQNANDDKNVKVTENFKDLQSNVIDCIGSTTADIDMKVLKDEICYKGDGKNKEDVEVQPNLLLSVLYKELMKTRQEVEKLRKVQELMLTEKGEKKADTAEQSSENMTDENSCNNERSLEKRKDHEVSDDTELKIDYDECHYNESKRSKICIRSDLLPTEDSIALDTISSDISGLQKSTSPAHQNSSCALTNPSVVQTNLEISVISVASSTVPNTSHPSRTSPAIPAASPGLSSNISISPKITSPLPRGHAKTSPGISSPGVSRTSPGIPKPSPTTTRASPGTPKSASGVSIASPGTSVSPAMPISPGIPRSSPGAPISSPGVPRMSPGLPRIHSGIPRVSPGAPMVSPGSSRNGLGSMRNCSEALIISPGIPQMSPTSTQVNIFNSPTNPSSTENLHSHSAMTTVQPKMTTVQSITSPVVPIPRFPQTPITSTAVSLISPTGGRTNCPVSRISPSISKIDTSATVPLNKTEPYSIDMSSTKLRSVFGISNSEVELMPVSAGTKQPLHEPQPQTFLKLVEDQHHQTNETPLLLNAVQGVRQDSGSKDVESSTSHGPVPFHNLGCHEDPKRISKTHHYVGEIKRHTYSTSDLPDHAASACKQPPPLKPVAALLRRHSDMDIHSVIHHQSMYPGTRKNVASSLHSSTSAAEHKRANSVHPFNQPQYSPTQYPLPSIGRRRNSENKSSERSQGYQQSVPVGMQHQYPHLPPGSSVMRSLGPDKATIFPIPPTIPTGIRPFRPTTPPSVTRAQLEQFQNENFYRSNFSFFEKIREKFAHSCDNGVSAMERLQPSTTNAEKPLQPQTFAPRVLVRESIPEAPSHIPTTTFTSLHFPNPNQPPPNAMASHQNHFSSNMHSGSSIHHVTQARLHTSTNQATSNIPHNSSSGRSGERLCFHCPQQARFICSGCKKAWYCSEQCQREHWSIHSAACVL